MKTYKYLLFSLALTVTAVSCDVEDGENLNGPTTDAISEDLSRGELNETMSGVFADMRTQLSTQTDAQSVAGREYWRFQTSDPRWTGDLLTGTLDNNTFYTTNPFAARYSVIKGLNIILEGLENTTTDFTAEEIAGIKGYANMLKAHEFLMLLNQQFQNGVRLDVLDPDNLGPFVSYDEAITAVATMLADSRTDLAAAGNTFAFTVPSGLSIASSPSGAIELNNAFAARVEAYRGNYDTALTYLNNSFLNLGGSFDEGAYFTFSLNGADIPNPLFFAQNSTGANARIAHPSFITDALPGDSRVNKATFRETPNEDTGVLEPNPATQSGLTGSYDVFIYTSNTDPVAFIRNEELILLYAEANHISNPGEAVNAINIVRASAGLDAYDGGTSPAELVNEIIYNRRYSLFAEGGHRWIDARRFGVLDALPLDRAGDGTFVQFPVPLTENQ
jgi:hypothetical protein